MTVEPTPPAAIKGPPTEENASAVAEYYVSLYPYVRATGDASSWKALAGPSCGYCSGILDGLEDMAARGEHTVDGAIEIHDSGARSSDDELFVSWVLMYEHASQMVNDDGDVIKKFPAEVQFRVTVVLTWHGDHWLVDGVDATRTGTS